METLTPLVREIVMMRDRHMCSVCGQVEVDWNRSTLHYLIVHHINNNPRDNSLNNLIALCRSCHIKYDIHSRTKWKRRLRQLARRRTKRTVKKLGEILEEYG